MCYSADIFNDQANHRYLPITLFAVAWLRSKISFANVLKAVGKRIADLAQAAKRRVFRNKERPSESVEMKRSLMT
jgi:hypothetical protein